MTIYAILYSIPGLVGFFAAFVNLLVKPKLLNCQWSLILSQMMLSIAMIFYSCNFNTFLYHEHLIRIMYELVALSCPPMFYISFLSVTSVGAEPIHRRWAFYPAILGWAVIVLSAFVGGTGRFHLFMDNLLRDGNLGMTNDWVYNMLLVVNVYFFLALLFVEIIFLACSVIPRLRDYSRLCNEYYTSHDGSLKRLSVLLSVCLIMVIVVALVQSLYPIYHHAAVAVVVGVSVVQCLVQLILGSFTYAITHCGEDVVRLLHEARLRNADDACQEDLSNCTLASLFKHVDSYVAGEKAFLNPELSVADLAARFHVSQERLIDSIHASRGNSFSEYVNGLRVERAIRIVFEHFESAGHEAYADKKGAQALAEIVGRQCGYVSASAFRVGFAQVMNESWETWLKG